MAFQQERIYPFLWQGSIALASGQKWPHYIRKTVLCGPGRLGNSPLLKHIPNAPYSVISFTTYHTSGTSTLPSTSWNAAYLLFKCPFPTSVKFVFWFHRLEMLFPSKTLDNTLSLTRLPALPLAFCTPSPNSVKCFLTFLTRSPGYAPAIRQGKEHDQSHKQKPKAGSGRLEMK